MAPHQSIEVIAADAYPERLTAALWHAQERAGLLAMVMGVDEATEPIFTAAQATAERRVPTFVLPDAYSRIFDDNVPAHPLTARGREAVEYTRQLRHKIGELGTYGAGVRYVHEYEPGLHPRSLNPFAGRNHAKISVADNHIFTAGGINLRQRYFQSVDYMLHTEHAGMADFLYDYMDELAMYGHAHGGEAYRQYDLDEYSSLVIDLGRPGQSLIYKAACRLVKNAVELTLVTQYPPRGRFRSLLAERQRSLPAGAVRVFHNMPQQFRMPGAALRRAEQTLLPRLQVHGSPDGRFIHAKTLLGRMEDGMPVTVSGSHNFQQSLVRMGTAEVALLSTNPQLYDGLRRYLQSARILAD